MSAATVPANQIFTFDGSATIADLLVVVKTLAKTGQRPKLRLVKSYNGDFESVAIDSGITMPSGEMAVAGHEDAPDPAEQDARWSTVRHDTPVYYNGEWCSWGDLAGNERTTCTFNADGVLVGGDPF